MSSTAASPTLRRSLALVWRSLRSMRTALVLLLLLALASVAGSLVPQIGVSPERVAQMFREHPLRADAYNAAGLFDVYGSWWFTLIYVLLLTSLGACLIPRTRALVRNVRAVPQPTRELDGFRHYAERTVAAEPDPVILAARKTLRRRWFRVSTSEDPHALAADKGLAREAGSLLFHWSFFLILLGVIVGKGTGFTGFAVISEGTCWTEAAANYDGTLRSGRFFGGDHTGVEVCVDDFGSRFRESGQPMDFVTTAELRDAEGGAPRSVDIRVNEPASIEGIRLYQYAFGWSPVIEVRRAGELIASGPVEFERDPVPDGVGELAVPWHGAIRLPSLEPQAGIEFQLWPDGRAFLQVATGGAPVAMTDVYQPLLRYRLFEGDLESEIRPTFSDLDTRTFHQVGKGIVGADQTVDLETGEVLEPGPDGRLDYGERLTGTFSELRRYTVLRVARDRGVWIVLVGALCILLGLIPALYTSRRKVWVRAESTGEGGSVLKIGGFALHRQAQFEEEFARLVDDLAPTAPGPRAPQSEGSEKVGAG